MIEIVPRSLSMLTPALVLGLATSASLSAQSSGNQDPQPPEREETREPEPARPGPQDPDRVVVTATRTEEDPFNVPYSTDVIDGQQMKRRSYRTVPQTLRDTPGVMVQETAHGHGSPYIRGFTSFRTLMMIDGVRLNNSAFRPGPNQYWNTVDPWSLERIEVVKGPGSVLHGSDAIGGTVNAITKSPATFAESGTAVGGGTFLRWSSAEDSLTGRGELSLGHTWEDGSRTGLLLGGTAKKFGDLEGGEDTGLQPETGYDDDAIDLKLVHHFEEDLKLVALHQRLGQDDVPRTHRTVNAVPYSGTTVGSDLQRQFDQDRYLSYVQLHAEDIGGMLDAVRANVSWQGQRERRDRIRGSGAQEFQGFDVGTFGAWVQAESPWEYGRWTYGVEWYRDDVDSYLDRPSSPSPADAIQGPVADDATYDLASAFVEHHSQLGDRFELTLGGRFSYAAADADSVRDPVTDTRIAIEDDWSDMVGSARLRYELVPGRVALFGGVSQGFRAPNLSDLSRFDSARTNEFEIPAPGLEAEEYVQYEVGTKVEEDEVGAQVAWFYTDIDDQILRFPTGNTNSAGENEVTKANIGDGYIQGIEIGSAWSFAEEWEAFGNATWMEGRVSNFANATSTLSNDYPSRLMPLTFQVGLRWEEPQGRFWAEGVYVHANDQDKLSFRDQGDTSRIPPGGTPGYEVFHLRTGWTIDERTSLFALLENVADRDYRVHGSGLNRPGRNVVIGFETRF